MRVRRAPVLWLLAWCGPLLLVATVTAILEADFPVPSDVSVLENTYPNVVFGSLIPLLGALILARLPGHPIGRLFLACGLASSLTIAVFVYAEWGLHHALPGTVAAAWVSEWVWGLGFTPMVTIGVLLFPDGLPGRRWRWLLWSDLLGVALVFVSNAFHPGRLGNHPKLMNPLGLPVPKEIFDVVGSVGFALFGVGILGGAAAAVLRWRRARGVERAQLSWFALSVAALAIAVMSPIPHVLGDVVTILAIPLVPVSIAVAILRRNLYGIEVAVRRSLVYGALTVVLLVGYAVVVTVLGTLARDRTSPAAALAGTALVAVAFAPLRDRLQHSADRLFYGDRRNPYAVLTGVGRRLDGPPTAGGDALAEIAETVATSLRLPYVRVDVRADPDGKPMTAEWGEPTATLHEVPLTYRGEPVGCLSAARRSAHEVFGSADLRLLDDLGRQVGVTAHAMLLGRDLQRSREQLVATREEERRRIRRDLHDGLGPALAGVALGLDAINRIAPTSAEEAAALADQLKLEVQASLADVRRLVEDLRPPALDQLGLVGAVRQHAAHLTEREPGLSVTVTADRVPPLPAAVEVAAYRITTEALTNVSRHACARHCSVRIDLDDDRLVLEIEDDGRGMPAPARHGVGTTAMRERAVELGGSCQTTAVTTGGTRVTARIPVPA